MRRVFVRALFAAATIATALSLCEGRVYLRSGARTGPLPFPPGEDGCVLYQSDVEVNGTKGQLCLQAFESNLADVIRRLRQAAKGPEQELHVAGGAQMGNGLLLEKESATRCFFLAVDPARSLVYTVRQSRDDYEKSLRHPPPHRLRDLPWYPGSTPIRSWLDAAVRTSVVVSRAGDSPAAVSRFFSDALPAAGWIPVGPSDSQDGPGASSPRVFLRGQELACVALRAEGDGSGCQITVLHKRFSTD